METKILDIKGKEKGTCALPDSLFAVKANPTFLHEVITAFLANQRSGTADTKTRSEVSGTRKAPAAPARAACAPFSSATAVSLSGRPRTPIARICRPPKEEPRLRWLFPPSSPKATWLCWTL